MRTASEVKSLMKDREKTVSEMFGISEEDHQRILEEVWNVVMTNTSSRITGGEYINDVILSVEILEDVCGIKNYTGEQLLYFVSVVQTLMSSGLSNMVER